MEFNKLFDHTLLKPEATEEQIKRLCAEAKEFDFASVCVNPCFVPLASKELKGSDVNVCTVIGFPLGANATAIKAAEARLALEEGATEIDMVQNIGWAKEGKWEQIAQEVYALKKECGPRVLKVILETCLLTPEEIRLSCLAAKKGGAKVEDVKLMRETVGPELGVKASGGIHHYEDVLALVAAGANRIGASASVAILEEKAKSC